LIGLALFFVIKSINRLQGQLAKPEEAKAEPEAPPANIQLLQEIRDLLKQKNS
jgi:large conductance mechanosensitive channel